MNRIEEKLSILKENNEKASEGTGNCRNGYS